MTGAGSQAVLQLVILRDGLLLGTEVLVPGTYTLGSSREAEIHLDDAQVEPLHALLYFQNGRTAIQDNGSRGGVYVNGHKVRACEIRSQDEVLVGPFLLKTRVLSQRPAARPPPPPEVAALLNRPATVPAMPGPAHPASAFTPSAPQPAPIPLRPSGPAPASSSTLPSARRPALAAVQPLSPPAMPPPPPPAVSGTVPSARRSQLAAVPAPVPLEADLPTESVPLPQDLVEETAVTAPGLLRYGQQVTQPGPVATSSGALGSATPGAPTLEDAVPAGAANAKAPKGPVAPAYSVQVELYWGELRREARTFRQLPKEGVLFGAHTDDAPVPMWGFSLPEERFALVEASARGYRVFIPPGAAVEARQNPHDPFMPVGPRGLEAEGGRRFLTLQQGAGVRLSEGELSLVVNAAVPPPLARGNPLSGLPWLVLVLFFLLGGGFVSLLVFGPQPRDEADFVPRNIPKAVVQLIAPEPKKKEQAQKKLAELKAKAPAAKKKAAAPAAKKTERTPQRTTPQAPAPSRALQALAKLSAGPASNDVLSAMDKAGPAGGKKGTTRLSDMVGGAPVANAGLGSIGLGSGKGSGGGTKGLEMLQGKGGIGALGAGGYGKGKKVGGTVTRASSRSVSAQGSIDRDKVARVINSNLQAVRACYERALLRDPGLAGKAVLEWSINTSGTVVTAKTKSSTLRNAEVEGCILRSIKTWKFPAAKGGKVIVTYPFVFNSVGY